MKKDLLLIFAKNPELGKVKTRLAKKIGAEKALVVYKFLLKHTFKVTQPLSCTKFVYYNNTIPEDNGLVGQYHQRLQKGADLGERMQNSFSEGFNKGYSNIVIIGSDCAQIGTILLDEAFQSLKTHDIVIGPAKDGGYYLLGMKKLFLSLFKDKLWSTDTVLRDTLSEIHSLGLSVYRLPVLTDIDEVEDLATLPEEVLL